MLTCATAEQEYFLHALSQPRPHASLDLMQDQNKELDTTGMRRSQSYHGLDPLGIPSAVYGAMHNIHASFIQAAHRRQTDKQQVDGCMRQSSLTSRQLQQRGSVKGSFRASDSHGNLAGMAGVGLTAGAGGAPSHVMSMLAEQVTLLSIIQPTQMAMKCTIQCPDRTWHLHHCRKLGMWATKSTGQLNLC